MLTTPGGIRGFLLGTTALLPVAAGPSAAQAPNAGPTGGRVVAGQAGINQGPGTTTVTQSSNRAAIDWQRFDVGRDHTVQFQQPNAGSWTLNRVTTPDPSLIAGRIQANGGVAIVNQSGVVFSQGSSVNVGALIASAANITNENFMAGRMRFDGAPRPGARVENHGEITVAERGLAAFVAPGVANTGTIRARLGRVALQGAETWTLDMAGDGLLSIDVTQAVRSGGVLVSNSGTIEAPGGAVTLSASTASHLVEDVVRQSGRITANRDPATGRTGQVAIRAPGAAVRVDGVVEATGGAVRIGDAVTARATVTGQISARGTGAGVRGGLITVEAKGSVTVAGGAKLDASGPAGGGTVLVGTTGVGREQRMAARTVVEERAAVTADATEAGSGGTVAINSTDSTAMRGNLSARGGPSGGDGGFIEVSGQRSLLIHGNVDVRAAAGRDGTFLIDPQNIIISDQGTPAIPAGDSVTETLTGSDALDPLVGVAAATSPGNGEWLRIATNAITGYSGGNITLTANRQIIVESGFDRTTAGNLTMLAGQAGAPTGADITILPGANITLNGVLSLDTGRGSISLGSEIRATGLVLNASGGITQTGGFVQHRDGNATALSVNAQSSGGAISLGSLDNGALQFTTASAAGNVTLRGRRIDLAGDLRATSATLEARDGISQSGGTIAHRDGQTTALPLIVRTTVGGDVALNGENGDLAVASGGLSAGSWSVAVRNGGTLTATAAISTAGGLVLRGTSLVTNPGAVLTGSSVTLRADSLNIGDRVAAPGGEINIRANSAGQAIVLGRDAVAGDPAGIYLNATEIGLLGGSGVAGSDVPASRLRLTASANITLDGTVALRGRVETLEVEGFVSSVTQPSGSLDVPNLVLRPNSGAVTLAQAGNVIDRVAATLGSGSGLTVVSTGAGAGTLLVAPLASSAGTIDGISGFNTVALTAAGLRLDAPITTSGFGSAVSLTATGAAGIEQATAGRITATTLTAVANATGAGIRLASGGSANTADWNAVANLGSISAGGVFDFTGNVPLAINGNVSAGADLTVRAPTITQTAGTISTGGTGATILLVGDAIALSGALSSVLASGGAATVAFQPYSDNTSVTYGAGAGLQLATTVSAGVSAPMMSLRATGSGTVTIASAINRGSGGLDLRGTSVSQSVGATITAGRISGSATSGNFSLTDAGNAFSAAGAIDAPFGNIQLVTASPLIAGGLTAGGSFLTLTASGIALEGALSAGTGGITGFVQLRANAGSIDLNTQSVSALGGGTISLAATIAINQNTGGAGALSGSAVLLSAIGFSAPSADLRGTGNALGAVQANLPGGLRLANTTALSVTGSGIVSATGDVALSAASIALNAPITAAGRTVTLVATGAGGITQSAGSPITAGILSVSAVAGSVTLDGGLVTRNAVAALGDSTVLGDLTLATNSSLVVGGLISADGIGARIGTLTLDTDGTITQPTGSVRAANVVFRSGAFILNNVTLAAAANDVGAFSGSAGGVVTLNSSGATSLGAISALALTVTSGGALAVTGTLSPTFGGISLTGASVSLGANLDAAGRSVSLIATGGDITQSAGRIQAGTLTLSATGSAVLDNGNPTLTAGLNEIGGFGAVTVAGDLVVRNQGNLPVGVVLSAGGGVPSASTALHSQTGNIIVAAGAGILTNALRLTAPNGEVSLPGAVSTVNGIFISAGIISLGGSLTNTALGGVELISPGAISLSGSVNAAGQRVTILSDGLVSQGSGGITAAELLVRGTAPGTAATSIELGGAGNAIGSIVEMRSAGNLRLRATGAMTVSGPVTAGPNGVLRLETTGLLTVAATGSVTAGDPALLQLGQVSLWGFGVRLEGPVQAGDGVTLFAAAGATSFFGLPTGTVPGTTISQAVSGAAITARRLATVAPNTVDLAGNGNAVDTIAHVGLGGNDVIFLSNRPLLRVGSSPLITSPVGETTVISGITGQNGNVSLRAAALQIAAPVLAGNGATVTLTSDDLAVNAPVTAANGTVILQPITAGMDFALGTAFTPTPGLIALSAAQVANIRTGTLRIEGSAGSAITLGTLDLRTGSTGTRVARVLDLIGESVTQTAGAELSVERVQGGVGGAFLLDQGGTRTAAGNTINILGPITAGGDVSILAGGVPDGAGGRRAPAVDALGNPLGGTAPLRLAGTVSAGGLLTLSADGLQLAGGSLAAGGGEMTLGTFSNGAGMTLGAADPTGPGLRLESGLATGLSITGGVTPVLTLLAPGGEVQVAGAFDLSGVNGPGRLMINAGRVSSFGGGALSVARLDAVAQSGGIDLTSGSHSISEVRLTVPSSALAGLISTLDLSVLGAATAGGDRIAVAQFGGRSVTLDGALRAGIVRLNATAPGGSITQSVALDAGLLQVGTQGGDVTLTNPVNTIEWLNTADLRNAALTEGGTLTLRTTSNLSLHNDFLGARIWAGTIDITAPSIGPAIAGGAQQVQMRAIGTGGGPTFLRLAATAGDIVLGAGSVIAASGTTPSTVEITATGRILSGGAAMSAGTSVTLDGGGDITLDGGSLIASTVVVEAGGALAMTATPISGDTVTLRALAGPLALTGAPTLTNLTVGGGFTASSGAGRDLTLRDMRIAAGGPVTLTAGNNLVVTRGSIDAGSSALSLTADNTNVFTGATLTGGPIAVSGSGVWVTGGSMVASGDLTANTMTGTIMAEGTVLTAAGALTLGGGSGLALANTSVAAASVSLANAGGDLSVTGGSVTATGTLNANSFRLGVFTSTTLSAGGALRISARGLTLTTTAISGASVDMLAGEEFAMRGGSVTSGGILRLSSDSITRITEGASFTAAGAITFSVVGDVLLSASSLTGGSVVLSGSQISVDGGSITAADGITLGTGSGALTLSNTRLAAGSTLSLSAPSAVTASGTTVSGADISITATSVSISGSLLTSTGRSDVEAMTGGVTLSSTQVTAAGALTLAGVAPFTATNSTLRGSSVSLAGNGIAMSGGGVETPGILFIQAGSGAATFADTQLSAGNTLTVAGGGAFSATDTTLRGNGVSLAGNGFSYSDGSVEATGALFIQAGTGAVQLRTTRFTASGALTLVAGAALTMSGTTLSGTDLAIAAGAGLAITGGNVTATGAFSLDAGGGGATFGSTQLSAAGALDLTARGAIIASDTAFSGGDLALAAGSDLAITGGGLTAVRSLRISSGAGVEFESTSLTAGGPLNMLAAGAMTATATDIAGADMAVTSNGIALSGGGLRAAGALVVNAGAGAAGFDTTLLAAAGPLTVTASGPLTGNATTFAGSSVTLAGSRVSLTGGRIDGGTALFVQSAGDAAFTDTVLSATDRIGVVAGGFIGVSRTGLDAGGITLAAQNGLTITSATLTAAGQAGVTGSAGQNGALAVSDTRITGPAIALAGGTGGTLIGVEANAAGALTVASDGGLSVTRSTLSGEAVALGAAGGSFAVIDSSLTASTTLSVLGTGASSLNSVAVNAETAVFRTRGTLNLGPFTGTLGSLLVFSAPGGIGSGGTVAVAPRAPATRFPAIVLDTRAGAATSQQPFLVQPDLPGVPTNAQATQVRAVPRSQVPGIFGPSTADAAGPMQFSIVAPSSAVFLLADGASIRGEIEAARLGVHGTGGDSQLFGTLNGRGGIAAAEFADLTRPIAPVALQRYRLNGCVLSAINCVALPPVLVVPSRLATDVTISVERQRVRNPDVIVPDIAVEDF